MNERKLELAAGGLLLAALVAGGGVALLVARSGPRHPVRFSVDFAFAASLPAGAPAKIGGYPVGRVAEIQFRPDGKDAETGALLPVRAVLELDRAAAAALHADAECFVATQGALGEPYLEIGPGSSAAPPLAEGAVLRGIDPPRTDLLIARLFLVLEQTAGVMTSDKEALVKLVRAASGIAGTVDELLRERKLSLSRALDDGTASIADVHRALPELLSRSQRVLTKLDDGADVLLELRRELPELVARAKSILVRLDEAHVGKDDADQVRALVAKLDKLSADLQRVSGEADVALGRVDRGEGTLGKLSKDPQVYDDLRAMLADLKAHPWKFLWKD